MLACLYDVHGNLPALEGVLADARRQGATRWLLGGDLALMGGWPAETVEILRVLERATWIRGNADRWLVDPPDDDDLRVAVADCRAEIGDADADALGALNPDAVVGGDRFVHASPVSDMRSFLGAPEPDEQELLEGVTEPRLVFGHTHIPFKRVSMFGGIELVNPGSVGVPLDGDHRAAYALIHPDRRVEQRRVEYDWQASADRLYEKFGEKPWTQMVHGRITRARL